MSTETSHTQALAHFTLALAHFTLALAYFTLALAHFTIALAHFTLALAHFTLALAHFTLALAHFTLAHITGTLYPDVQVEDGVGMHVMESLQQLPHQTSHHLLIESSSAHQMFQNWSAIDARGHKKNNCIHTCIRTSWICLQYI